ncbi:VOC family protein [Nocardioides hwasunensis]|uniref:VOC family protein n=1 Tax=Nocardioides hwasunensis TaxID=397258 RepID=A0ABR8MCW3_9ACTN|nr:VOC family protein [Nocardioides hwasunensis]MBD3913974.1 VOC family protein [Nocardioides hwasunensis]
MTLSIGMITIDTPAATPLATWWAERFGAAVVQDFGGEFVILGGGGLPVLLGFQQVEDATPGKNRIHLDLAASDLDGAVDELVAAGAGLVERRGDDTFRWVTLTDPDGNLFCVSGQHDAEQALT